MKKYIKEQDHYIKKQMRSQKIDDEIFKYHLRQIEWLQHERLIHLIVLCLSSIIFLGIVVLILFYESILLMILALILGILELFYLFHYFVLENTVQKWYDISNTITHELTGIGIEKQL